MRALMLNYKYSLPGLRVAPILEHIYGILVALLSLFVHFLHCHHGLLTFSTSILYWDINYYTLI